jgi:hypothetical protein
MSLADSFQNVRTMPIITASASDIPQSIMSSQAPRPIASRVALKSVNAQVGTQTSNGQLLFQLGCGSGQGFVKAGSVYVRALITIVNGVAGTTSWSFNGPDKSASQIILRLTTYINGQICESIQYYNRLRSALLEHCSSYGYYNNDSAILEQTGTATNATTVNTYVCIPLCSGLFNGDHDLPVFLANTLTVQLDLDSYTNGILITTAGGATDFQVSSASLIYQVFYPEIQFENDMRAVLASGKLFQMPIKSWYNLVISNAGAIKSQPIGLNMSSVNAIFHTSMTATGGAQQFLVSDYGGASATYFGEGASAMNLRVFFDGNLQNSFNIDRTAFQLAECHRALNTFQDPERSIGPAITGATYNTQYFLGGLASLKTAENGLCMSGSAVSQAICEITNSGSAGNCYIFVSYSQILTIDANGVSQLIR